MKLIATQTLTSAQPSISFSSIPQNFQDLVLLVSARSTSADPGGSWYGIAFNGSSTTTSTIYLQASGNAVGTTTLDGFAGVAASSSGTANTFCNDMITIPNYASSTTKSYSVDSVSENNATGAYSQIIAGRWNVSSAITSISLVPSGTNFLTGTMVSLYGVGGAGSSAAKATGGMIQRVGDYWVHTFTASGTFTPTANLTDVEYLVIAGGGGGGLQHGGGGGAGGYRCSVPGEASGGGASAEARLSLTSGISYTVAVGAGGAGSPAVATNGTGVTASAGTSSAFSTISTVGGGGGGTYGGGAGTSGGSGGGGKSNPTATGGAGTSNQGFAGGTGQEGGPDYAAGGGGGAGSVGANAVAAASTAGNGGSGVSSSITGTSIARAGGGGGGIYRTTSGATRGLGQAGGGNGGVAFGSDVTQFSPTNAAVSSGSGGGGNGTWNTNAGNGASGIVIVRYLA